MSQADEKTWIFQCKPSTFDIDGYLETTPKRMSWLVRQGRSLIRIGDPVFLWRSQRFKNDQDFGVIAELRIASGVAVRADDPEAARFWRNAADGNKPANRVWLDVVKIGGAKVLNRAALVAGGVAKAGPLGFANATNYVLTPDEASIVSSLWKTTTRDLTSADVPAALEALGLDQLMSLYRGGDAPQKRRIETTVFTRADIVKAITLKRADRRCELAGCSWAPFLDRDGRRYAEVHHIMPLADGGPDTIDNTACVCPGHHREAHAGRDRTGIADALRARRRPNGS